MTAFVWGFPLERLFAVTSFPGQFVCSPDEMGSDPSALTGSRIWLLANSTEGYSLFGHLVVESVSVIQEGRDKGFFILEANRLCSFRILPHDPDLLNPWIVRTPAIYNGISSCSAQLEASLFDVIRGNTRITYGVPRRSKVILLPKAPSGFSSSAIVRHYFQEALSRFALGELARSEQDPDLTPYGIIVSINCTAPEYGQNVFSELTQIDSQIKSLLESGGFDRIRHALQTPSPFSLVDTTLTTLVPETIVARDFLPTNHDIDLGAALAKTQDAEFRHQAILRDIARFLSSKGIHPLESRSVDIAYWKSESLILAEIKSATATNFLDQVRRGIIQLLEYGLAFKQEGCHIGTTTLIVEAIKSPLNMQYCRKLASYANIELLIYDENAAWPDRVERISEVMLYEK